MNMTLLIMAAGNGSRYGALKQFDELGPNNEFLFEYSIYDAINYGFDHIVIVTKEKFILKIKNYLSKRIARNIKIDIIAQKIDDIPIRINKNFTREKPWGTSHAVWVTRNFIFDDFVVINSDDYYGKDAFKKAAIFINENKSTNIFGLVPYKLKDTLSVHGSVSRGICQVDGTILNSINELINIEKKGDTIVDFDSNTILSGHEFTSMNFWIFNPSIFDKIEKQIREFLNNIENIEKGEIFIPFVIKKLIDLNKASVKLTKPTSSWFGITYADDKFDAMQLIKNMIRDKEYPMQLWKN